MSEVHAAPSTSEAEDLRDQNFSNGEWFLNGMRVTKDRSALLGLIAEAELQHSTQVEEEDRKYKAFTKARDAYQNAQIEQGKRKRKMQILKLALADQLGIPT